jgi:anthranilate synthase component 1
MLPLSSGAFSSNLLNLSSQYPGRYPFYLTSCGTGWDILFAFPEEIEVFSAETTLMSCCKKLDWVLPTDQKSPWPFCGGWFVYLSYDLATTKRGTEPLGFIARIPAAILKKGKEIFFVCEKGYESLANTVEKDLGSLPSSSAMPALLEVIEEPAHDFMEGVLQIQKAIAAGETYQVNLARQWQAYFADTLPIHAVFQKLNQVNPAPFSALVTIPETSFGILSASPERLVRVKQGVIETQPIAGTRPRFPGADEKMRQELSAHPKERSEHIMLVDLARNDLSRVGIPGSVEVSSLLDVTTYAHVHHLESTVKARLRAGVRAGDVIEALFPGGTITGCPKKHTMDLIDQIEKTPRGAYTGSVGYISLDGQMDLNILIRTMVANGDRLTFKTGAGIVADSSPEFELEETRAKAKGLMLTLE